MSRSISYMANGMSRRQIPRYLALTFVMYERSWFWQCARNN